MPKIVLDLTDAELEALLDIVEDSYEDFKMGPCCDEDVEEYETQGPVVASLFDKVVTEANKA